MLESISVADHEDEIRNNPAIITKADAMAGWGEQIMRHDTFLKEAEQFNPIFEWDMVEAAKRFASMAAIRAQAYLNIANQLSA